MTDERWCVVGLGNPGLRYAGNRHNAGAMVADVLAKRYAARLQALRSRPARGLADVADVRIGGRPVTLAIPRSFMNESGAPVAAVRSYYRVDVARLVIVHDELDIDFGRLRLKRGGGEGGHNGLRSVSQALGSQDYYRVRMGIGRPPGRQDPADYVLRDFGAAERRELPPVLERAADAVEALIDSGLEAAQQSFNS
ncbi:MAG: aminoacyl-tRNA hydrolase [Mycobacteriales bacterium]